MGDKQAFKSLVASLDKLDVKLIPPVPVRKLPTGILSWDRMLYGGMPRGRTIEMFGDQGTGKSTTAMLLMRQYMAQDEPVVLLDSEGTFDVEYAAKFGIDTAALSSDGVPLLSIFHTETAEQWFDATRELIRAAVQKLIVIDTFAAFVPKVEYESSISQGTMGVFPRLVSRFFRMVAPLMSRPGNDVTLLILNQERLDIGNANVYTGAPKIGPGGQALKHNSSIMIHTLKPQDVVKDGDLTGLVFRMQIVKSKLFTVVPKTVYELRLSIDNVNSIYEVDAAYELFSAAKAAGLLTGKDGSPWEKNVAFFEGTNLGNGVDQILAFLDQPSITRDSLTARLYEGIEHDLPAHVETGDRGGEDPDETPEEGGRPPDLFGDGENL